MRFNHLYLDLYSGLAATDQSKKVDFVRMAAKQLRKVAKGLGLSKSDYRLGVSESGSGSARLQTPFGSVVVMGHGRSDKAIILITPGRNDEGQDHQVSSALLADAQAFGFELLRAAKQQGFLPTPLLPEHFKL